MLRALSICTFALAATAALAADPAGTWLHKAKNGGESYTVTLTLAKDHTWKMNDPKIGFDPQISQGKWSQTGAKVVLLNKWQLDNHKTATSLAFALDKAGNALKSTVPGMPSYTRKR